MDNGLEIIPECTCGKRIESDKDSREGISADKDIFSNTTVSNISDQEEFNQFGFLQYVESLIENGALTAAERSVLKSYISICHNNDSSTYLSSIRVWVSMQLRKGATYHTLRKYVSIIRAKLSEYLGVALETVQFQLPDLKSLVDRSSLPATVLTQRKDNLSILRNIVTQRRFPDGDRDLWGIFLYLLYTCSDSLIDAVNLRYEDVSEEFEHVKEVCDNCRTHAQRRYVFQLCQGKKRSAQILRETASGIDSLLHRLGMEFNGGFCMSSIKSMWIDAAFGSGISPVDIRSIVGKIPSSDSYLELLPESHISQTERFSILRRVAEHVCPHDEQWHVMRLRQSVSVTDIQERGREKLPNLMRRLTLYYPTREIIFKENKKIIKREVPYIPGLLFFRIGTNQIVPLMREIGDLAWCYKERNSPGANYSVIPRVEMERFQRYVGKFTEDVEMELASNVSLGIGRRVRITGGMMEGYEGEIQDIEESTENGCRRRLFQLNISSDQALRWTVSIEDVYIEAID